MRLALDLDPIPNPPTEEGRELYSLWWLTNWAGLAVGVLVFALVAWCVIRYRRRSDALPDQSPGRASIELLYTLGALALVLVIFAISWGVQYRVDDTEEDPDQRVEVLGFNWQWQFTYPADGDRDEVVITGTRERVPTLVLPVGEVVQLELDSPDVIHSFWVPRFLHKRDLIPGHDNRLELVLEERGEWSGHCAEFCGLDHHRMRFTVRGVPPDEFDAWLDDQADQAAAAVGP